MPAAEAQKPVVVAETVRVRVNEGSFVFYSGKSFSGFYDVIQVNDKTQKRVWKGEELWVTPKQAEEWTTKTDTKRPLVTIVGNRSLEDAKGKPDPKQDPTPKAPATA